MLANDITRPFDLKGAPQIAGPKTTASIMRDVLIALAPACMASVCIFGLDAAVVLALSVASCVGFEYLWCRIRKIPPTVFDLSAAVTGVLLAMNLPSTLPLPMVVVGAFVAIVVAKELFGGIGRNIANPAIVGRIFLALSFPAAMATFGLPNVVVGNPDLISSATPLAPSSATPTLLQLFLGTHAGTLGETCSVALVLGMAYLIATKTIRWEMPACYLGGICLLSLVCGHDPIVEVLEGGVLLGAGFMITDYTTSPHTLKGKVVFSLGCALITCLIRFFGNLNEGVAYSILFMNLLVPHIDRHFVNVPLGTESKRKSKRKGGE